MTAGRPLSYQQLIALFDTSEKPTLAEVKQAIAQLQTECEGRGIELRPAGQGFRYQSRQSMVPWLSKLWETKPRSYSRAFLETLAIIVYYQPVTRGDIESVRGVSVSPSIIRNLLEQEWITMAGRKEIPGRPELFATTNKFLESFNLTSLKDLTPIDELMEEFDKANPPSSFPITSSQVIPSVTEHSIN